MTYQLMVSPVADKDIVGLPQHVRRRVLEAFVKIKDNPRHTGSLKLVGSDRTYRVRVGDWRIVYEVDDASLTIVVKIVRHRREVYRF